MYIETLYNTSAPLYSHEDLEKLVSNAQPNPDLYHLPEQELTVAQKALHGAQGVLFQHKYGFRTYIQDSKKIYCGFSTRKEINSLAPVTGVCLDYDDIYKDFDESDLYQLVTDRMADVRIKRHNKNYMQSSKQKMSFGFRITARVEEGYNAQARHRTCVETILRAYGFKKGDGTFFAGFKRDRAANCWVLCIYVIPAVYLWGKKEAVIKTLPKGMYRSTKTGRLCKADNPYAKEIYPKGHAFTANVYFGRNTHFLDVGSKSGTLTPWERNIRAITARRALSDLFLRFGYAAKHIYLGRYDRNTWPLNDFRNVGHKYIMKLNGMFQGLEQHCLAHIEQAIQGHQDDRAYEDFENLINRLRRIQMYGVIPAVKYRTNAKQLVFQPLYASTGEFWKFRTELKKRMLDEIHAFQRKWLA